MEIGVKGSTHCPVRYREPLTCRDVMYQKLWLNLLYHILNDVPDIIKLERSLMNHKRAR